MKINNLTSPNFSAIHLKNVSFKDMGTAAMLLETSGLEFVGTKKAYFSKENVKGIKHFLKKERLTILTDNPLEFISIFLPWNKEGYLLSTPKNEQFMYSMFRDSKFDASIDFLI